MPIFSNQDRFRHHSPEENGGSSNVYVPQSVVAEYRSGPKMVANWVNDDGRKNSEEGAPGPGQYNIPRSFLKKGRGAPIVPRREFGSQYHNITQNRVPGPAAYNVAVQFGHKGYNKKSFGPILPERPRQPFHPTVSRPFRMHSGHSDRVQMIANKPPSPPPVSAKEKAISNPFRKFSGNTLSANTNSKANGAIRSIVGGSGRPGLVPMPFPHAHSDPYTLDLRLPSRPESGPASSYSSRSANAALESDNRFGFGTDSETHGISLLGPPPSSPAYMHKTHQHGKRGSNGEILESEHESSNMVVSVATNLLQITETEKMRSRMNGSLNLDHYPAAFDEASGQAIQEALLTAAHVDHEASKSATAATTLISVDRVQSPFRPTSRGHTLDSPVHHPRRKEPSHEADRSRVGIESKMTASLDQAARSVPAQIIRIQTALADMKILASVEAEDRQTRDEALFTPTKQHIVPHAHTAAHTASEQSASDDGDDTATSSVEYPLTLECIREEVIAEVNAEDTDVLTAINLQTTAALEEWKKQRDLEFDTTHGNVPKEQQEDHLKEELHLRHTQIQLDHLREQQQMHKEEEYGRTLLRLIGKNGTEADNAAALTLDAERVIEEQELQRPKEESKNQVILEKNREQEELKRQMEEKKRRNKEQEAELQRSLAENLVLKKMEEIVAKKAAKDANDEAERILKQARADERARQRELKQQRSVQSLPEDGTSLSRQGSTASTGRKLMASMLANDNIVNNVPGREVPEKEVNRVEQENVTILSSEDTPESPKFLEFHQKHSHQAYANHVAKDKDMTISPISAKMRSKMHRKATAEKSRIGIPSASLEVPANGTVLHKGDFEDLFERRKPQGAVVSASERARAHRRRLSPKKNRPKQPTPPETGTGSGSIPVGQSVPYSEKSSGSGSGSGKQGRSASPVDRPSPGTQSNVLSPFSAGPSIKKNFTDDRMVQIQEERRKELQNLYMNQMLAAFDNKDKVMGIYRAATGHNPDNKYSPVKHTRKTLPNENAADGSDDKDGSLLNINVSSATSGGESAPLTAPAAIKKTHAPPGVSAKDRAKTHRQKLKAKGSLSADDENIRGKKIPTKPLSRKSSKPTVRPTSSSNNKSNRIQSNTEEAEANLAKVSKIINMSTPPERQEEIQGSRKQDQKGQGDTSIVVGNAADVERLSDFNTQ